MGQKIVKAQERIYLNMTVRCIILRQLNQNLKL
jgi:hypothetical protein